MTQIIKVCSQAEHDRLNTILTIYDDWDAENQKFIFLGRDEDDLVYDSLEEWEEEDDVTVVRSEQITQISDFKWVK